MYLSYKQKADVDRTLEEIMLENSSVANIAEFHLKEHNGEKTYLIDIKNYTSLKNLCETELIGKEHVVGILNSIAETADDMERFYLERDCLMLTPQGIFKDGNGYKLVYIPGVKADFNKRLISLLSFLMQNIAYNDKESFETLYRAMNALKNKGFYPGVFKDVLSPVRVEPEKKYQVENDFSNLDSIWEDTEEYSKKPEVNKEKRKGETGKKEHSSQPLTDAVIRLYKRIKEKRAEKEGKDDLWKDKENEEIIFYDNN